jgi:hypothetical protein
MKMPKTIDNEIFIDGKKYIRQNVVLQRLMKKEITRYIGLKILKEGWDVWIEEESLQQYLEFKSYLEENYLRHKELMKTLSLNQLSMEKAIKDYQPNGMLCWLGNRSTIYYPKSFVEIYKENTINADKEYMDSNEIMELLNISVRVLKKARDIGWLGDTLSKSNMFYNKREKVLALKAEIEKEDKYIAEKGLIPLQEARKYYPYENEVHSATVNYLIKKYKVEAFERKYKVRKEHNISYIPLSIVKDYVQSLDETLLKGIEDPMEMLVEGFKSIKVSPKLSKTMELLKRYSVQSVSNSNGNNRSRLLLARAYINRAKLLRNILTKELYEYSDLELEMLYKSKRLNQNDKKILTRFLNFLKGQSESNFKNKYSFKDVKLKKADAEEIYDFSTFFQFYKIVKDLDRNVCKAVKDRVYASTWLYVALTTVNGWRPSDLNLLPQIDVKFLNVNSLEELLYRPLTSQEITIIIKQIDNMHITHFEVSKNQFRRNFYVNEGLRKALATSYTICQLHSTMANDGQMIHFNTKHNLPYKRVWKMFFGDNKFSDFNTLKMNKSLLTHLYNNIKDKSGDSYLAYELARALRNHEAPNDLDEYEFSETTKIYIRQVSKEGFVDNALVELFDRGEFGYLYYLISEGAKTESGEKLTLSEETSLINHIQNKLSPSQMESLAQFMSYSESKRTTLATEVSKKSQVELNKIINLLYLGHMPSKVTDYQCFKYSNCPFPTKNDCQSCVFSIPYAAVLGSIAKDLSERIQNILNQTNYINIQRDRSVIHSLMDKVGDAIQDFGLEFVQDYIDLVGLQEQLVEVAERIKSVERMYLETIE